MPRISALCRTGVSPSSPLQHPPRCHSSLTNGHHEERLPCFQLLPWRLPDRAVQMKPLLLRGNTVTTPVVCAHFYRNSGRGEMWPRCASRPWRNSRWIHSNILSDRFPTQGKKDLNFTTTTKITDWDIPATWTVTPAVKSYFGWLRVTQLSRQVIQPILSLWHQEIMTLVTALPAHSLAK